MRLQTQVTMSMRELDRLKIIQAIVDGELIDATVVLVARSGDRILTSDPDDIGRLASSSGKELAIVPC